MTEQKPKRMRTLNAEERAKLGFVALPSACTYHPTVLVEWTAGVEEEFCGDSWCTGTCGLPAAILEATPSCRELKLHSNMVAAGPLMQSWRVTWTGKKRVIPAEYSAVLLKWWWW
jgi:hypothetical protein